MTATFEQATRSGERLAPVRRTYIYLVAFVSLGVALAGMGSLVDSLARLWLDQGGDTVGVYIYNRSLAASAGLLLVATPIFLVHWGLAQARRREIEERSSLLRKLFLYAASALSLAWMVTAAYGLIYNITAVALGQPLAEADLWPSGWLAALIMAVTNGALVMYWYAILRGDGDFGAETTAGRIVRQLFMLLAGLTGLVLMLWGAASGLQVLLNLLVVTLGVGAGEVTSGLRWWQNALAERVHAGVGRRLACVHQSRPVARDHCGASARRTCCAAPAVPVCRSCYRRHCDADAGRPAAP